MSLINEFIPKAYTLIPEHGSFSWSAPSNIALVKYWGKKQDQIPANPSLSFTLQNCKTVTSIEFSAHPTNLVTDDFSFEVLLDGEHTPSFEPKIKKFFERITPYMPFLKRYHFTIRTHNTFPHSSGIASSASGMAALALNLMSIERLMDPDMTEDYFYQKASFLARLGSGSACRSVRGSVVCWGTDPAVSGSTDLYGVSFPGKLHPVFQNYQDTILLVDKGEKVVSSTVGHDLMHQHPYAPARFVQASDNLAKISNILTTGDLEAFVALVESEALTLHAMMMTSMPYFILMKPATLEIINRIWAFRNRTNVQVAFTLDAGANVHVLYPESEKDAVLAFIDSDLAPFCQNRQYICDHLGNGAIQA
jgi:diphosphomevalonate decarboxylase